LKINKMEVGYGMCEVRHFLGLFYEELTLKSHFPHHTAHLKKHIEKVV